jgi:hypothetical protein
MRYKVDYVFAIAELIDIEPPHMSTGSTEPRELFSAVNDQLGLGLPSAGTKPELARGIVEASGSAWLPTFESTGSTVTLDGLKAVHAAVEFFTAK